MSKVVWKNPMRALSQIPRLNLVKTLIVSLQVERNQDGLVEGIYDQSMVF